jgi:hypothetical protein
MNKIIIIALLISTTFSACKKNEVTSTASTVADGGFVKFGHWIARATPNNAPIQIKINGERVSYSFRYAESFPGGGANQGGSLTNDYLNVPVGKSTVQLSYVNAGTTNDSLIIYTGQLSVTKGRYYSMFFTDSSSVKATLVDDAILENNPPNSASAKFKFFNGIPNAPLVDVYLGTTSTTPVLTSVPFNGFSNYINFPLGSQTVTIRAAGAAVLSTNIIASQAVTVAGGRIFTVASRGYAGLAITDSRRVFISTNTTR